MPMPEYVYMHSNMDAHFYVRATWKLQVVYWPKKCELTNKWIWPGSHAYQGTAIWHGPGEPIEEVRWHNSVDHLLWLLKE
jgi:hypothetical protein